MDCQRCRERLQEYLDGTLETDEQALVSVHVASCEACRRELDELRTVAALVGSLDEVPEPAGFLQAVRERIDRPTVWERLTGVLSRPPRPSVSVAIPVIIVAFVAVFIIMTNLPKTTEHAEPAEKDESGEQIEIAKAIESPDTTPSEPEPGNNYFAEQQPERDKRSSSELGETGTSEGSVGDAWGRNLTKGGAVETGAAEPTGNEKTVERATLNGRSRAAGETQTRETGATDETAGRSQRVEVVEEDKDESAVDLTDAEETQEELVVTGSLSGMSLGDRQQPRTVIELVVYDLPTDLTNVQRIVKEKGGYVKEVREDGALKVLNLYFAADSYDKAVEQLNLYSGQSKQEREQKKRDRDDKTETIEAGTSFGAGPTPNVLKTLRLVIWRVAGQEPTVEAGSESESESE